MTKALKILMGILLAILLLIGGCALYDNNKTPMPENTEMKEENDSKEETPEPADQEENSEEESKTEEETEEITGPHGESDPAFSDTDSYLILANKKHRLPEGYEPSDLAYPEVEMRYGNWTLRWDAAIALEDMFHAAAADGVTLILGSGYRSEETQAYFYNLYVEQSGQEYADTISSRPGYSDHQTGLATDLCGVSNTDADLSTSFEDTPEGQWLREHAHEYGWIMRYPKGKAEITGYAYEPWHFRYIGVEEATKIYNIDQFYSFEEYYGVEGGDYAE